MLSCLAGASTCVGAAIVFVWDASQIQQSMPFSLSLAASVMITVSVISILPECLEGVIEIEKWQFVMVDVGKLSQRVFSFLLGCASYWMLSKLLQAFPEPETLLFGKSKIENDTIKEDDEEQGLVANDELRNTNNTRPKSSPNQRIRRSSTTNRQLSRNTTSDSLAVSRTSSIESTDSQISEFQVKEDSKKRSWRVAMLLFVSLLCHNFPEGLAVAASSIESRQLGITVAIGILIHNIPEGIAIAVPCIAARPDQKWLAFWLASVSGLAEPLGAMVALGVLQNEKYKNLSLENVLASVAGIMCAVAALELYPEAYRSKAYSNQQSDEQHNRSIALGTVCGMAIMVATEWYLPG